MVALTSALLFGVGAASLLASTAKDLSWSALADVGDSFGVLNALFSGLALAAVVVTFWMQFTELRSQRGELEVQRHALVQTQAELRRSAEADVRRLHMDLMKMSIADPKLAAVWPKVTDSEIRNRQYQYVNLILQHTWMRHFGEIDEEELRRTFRYLFLSPIIRDYWAATAEARASALVAGSFEHKMNQVGDEIRAECKQTLGM
ncbi:DUF6082 family protein [Asanoa siamensis]|uniref:DUF6082 family protein n=1 Tax=Asanoa siamensis TaxID=926357 RepID=UPI00194522DF|nr:DUF6082 family protein [Asanoa siamensis]